MYVTSSWKCSGRRLALHSLSFLFVFVDSPRATPERTRMTIVLLSSSLSLLVASVVRNVVVVRGARRTKHGLPENHDQ